MIRTSILATAIALAQPAAAFMAENRLVVAPTGPQGFEVPFRGVSSIPAFWCAAGDYVRRELGLGPATEIYRVSGPRGPGQGVRFSLDPAGARATGLLMLYNDDLGLSAAHARSLCDLETAD